ncbi:hypothetical protein EDB85DRAFT_528371 [Lactarius pseudohatsudake]|nr:hypothetical protein EDB85DRAFT_528371 [Lactarius pseudohatsudake]
MMSFVSSNNRSPSYGARPPSLAPQQLELDYHEAIAAHDVPFPDDFLVGGEFAADPFLDGSSQVFPPAGFRNVRPFVRSHFGEPQRAGRSSPHGAQQPASFGSFPTIHPAVAPQSPFDGTYSLQTHPSVWYPGPSTASYGGGEQAALAGGHNMAVPMAMMPPAAASPFSSGQVTFPMSGSPSGSHPPIVRPWHPATATLAGASTRTAPQPTPVATFCRCNLRAVPLIRIDDRIEWVRHDLMRMVVWYNWSLNADDEAHDSWERRG